MAPAKHDHDHDHEVDPAELLPVTLLCGFLGAGKTTLLKHVLETKHEQDDFRCAVIVNDMASLNIDKSLIDQSALVQSDEVIAMQNGCFCCTLSSDLVDQIISLAEKKQFNYMLIEASGVSEPSQIAPLFDLCDDEHDHEKEHKEGPQLGEVARLDTCVTVVDAAEFHNNLDSMKSYENGPEMAGTISELLMEQVEFSNVVVLNKQDLVTPQQLEDVMDRISLINPKAKVIKSSQSQINVMDILNTHRFDSKELGFESIMLAATRVEPEPEPSCCIKSVNEGGKKCCKKKNKQTLFDTGLSQILLGVIPNAATDNKATEKTRHEKRFGITSFVYRARRPFHPGRLHDLIMDPFFMCSELTSPDEVSKLQKEAGVKQKKRIEEIGELLRSKGFIWIASTNDVMGGWQQAGNILRIAAEGPWMCEAREMWEGTPVEEQVKKDMTQESTGEEYEYGDRRQELVFIGIALKHQVIQKGLDDCLLTDEEMSMSPEEWKQNMEAEDRIKLTLDDGNEISLAPGQTHEEYWGMNLTETEKDFFWEPPEEEEDDIEHSIRLTQACLGRNPKEGERNLVEVTIENDDGKKVTNSIVALRTGPFECVHLDLGFTKPFQLSLVEGSGPISLTGFHWTTRLDGEEEEEEEDEEEEEEMIEPEPKQKKKKKTKEFRRKDSGGDDELAAARDIMKEKKRKKEKAMRRGSEEPAKRRNISA